MPRASGPPPPDGPEQVRGEIERFLKSSLRPALFEPGEAPLPIDASSCAVECRNGHLTLQAWDQTRNLVRRVTGVREARPGKLELVVERFGGRSGTMTLADLARPGSGHVERRGRRLEFRERFRRGLARAFAGWSLREISTEPDLEHSLSPAYARAYLKRGASGWAAVGCPPGADDSALLTFGLIWLDYLRTRERRVSVEALALFVPEGRHLATCLRLRWLNPRAGRFAMFVQSADGFEERLDTADWGNLDSRLDVCGNASERAAPAGGPEQVLESQVREYLEDIDAALLPAPVYGQVPSMAGGERGVIDLVACGRRGRLAVLELKASQDIHLPLQALDYWMRVAWHAGREEFTARGYFPGVTITNQAPRLLLVAPALEFHPATETILRYLSPEIEVERIGLAADWRTRPRVMFRLRGAQRP